MPGAGIARARGEDLTFQDLQQRREDHLAAHGRAARSAVVVSSVTRVREPSPRSVRVGPRRVTWDERPGAGTTSGWPARRGSRLERPSPPLWDGSAPGGHAPGPMSSSTATGPAAGPAASSPKDRHRCRQQVTPRNRRRPQVTTAIAGHFHVFRRSRPAWIPEGPTLGPRRPSTVPTTRRQGRRRPSATRPSSSTTTQSAFPAGASWGRRVGPRVEAPCTAQSETRWQVGRSARTRPPRPRRRGPALA